MLCEEIQEIRKGTSIRISGTCPAKGCSNPVKFYGFCKKHHKVWQHHLSATRSGNKRCLVCKDRKPINKFDLREDMKCFKEICISCSNAHSLKGLPKEGLAAQMNRLANNLKRSQVLRAKVVAGYGGKCACVGCPVTEPELLAIDHVNNDGAKLRKIRGRKEVGPLLLQRLIDEGFPPEYQVLCHGCNMSKSYPRNKGKCGVHNTVMSAKR